MILNDQVLCIVEEKVAALEERAPTVGTRSAWEAAILAREAVRHLKDAQLLEEQDEPERQVLMPDETEVQGKER